jgi:hypothetical protein
MEIEVVEIYPYVSREKKAPKMVIPDKLKSDKQKIFQEPKKQKWKETGTVHIYIKDWNIDLKSIMYLVDQKDNVKCFMPGKKYLIEGKKVMVPLVSFRDKEVRKEILCFVRDEIKKTLS